MKQKIFYWGFSCFLVATLILSACSQKTTSSTTTTMSSVLTTSNTPTAETTPSTTSVSTTSTNVANVPQYGGKMTFLNDVGTQDPSSWDPHLSQTGNLTSVYINPYLEWYFYGDIDKFGPRGSNQYLFQLTTYIPEQYVTGGLAQSWVFSTNPLSLTVTLKQGIMWTGNTRIGMAPREVTSADCAFSGTRQISAPATAFVFSWIKDCVAVDKYTFRWDFNTYSSNWQLFLLWGGASAVAICPESANAPTNASDWRNAVGTGPFILSDYVSGSAVTYTKNPNYWGKATINGKPYQEPFIDTLVYPIIPDPSTQLAALRTGKIDWYTQVPFNNVAPLKQQAPNLVQQQFLVGRIDIIEMNRIDPGPLANLNVRQALMMATDFNSIAKLVYLGGDILGWPGARGNPSYTPIENLPTSTQALFSYNPTKAKQLLTDAGYGSGFTTTISLNSAIPQEVNEATVLAAQWAKVGVTLQIIQMNAVALAAAKNNRTYSGVIDLQIATSNVLTPISYYEAQSPGAVYKKGEPLDIASNAVMAEMDSMKRQTLVTQFCQDALVDSGIIPMANPYILNCYWPWLKNYYGEIDAGAHNQLPMIKEMWIDQALKKSMGY